MTKDPIASEHVAQPPPAGSPMLDVTPTAVELTR